MVFQVLYLGGVVVGSEVKYLRSVEHIKEEHSDEIHKEEKVEISERRSDKESISGINVNRTIEEDGNIFRIMKIVRRNLKGRGDNFDTPLKQELRNIKLKVNSEFKKRKFKSPDHEVKRKNRQIYRGDFIKHIKQKGRLKQGKNIFVNNG